MSREYIALFCYCYQLLFQPPPIHIVNNNQELCNNIFP